MNEHELLVVKNLKKYFPIKKRLLDKEQKHVKAVDGISFSIGHGETLGLVGESGCGKSTVGRTILRLLEPTGGSVRFEGVDLCALKENELREKRKDFQIIFQDPFSSLDSRFRIEQTLKEPMEIQKMYPSKKRDGCTGHRADEHGRPEAGLRQPLSARVFRGTAPENQHCPGIGGPAQAHRMRRVCLRAGRLYPGANHQSAGAAAQRNGTGLPVYLPRSAGSQAYFRPDCSYVLGGVGRNQHKR